LYHFEPKLLNFSRFSSILPVRLRSNRAALPKMPPHLKKSCFLQSSGTERKLWWEQQIHGLLLEIPKHKVIKELWSWVSTDIIRRAGCWVTEWVCSYHGKFIWWPMSLSN